MLPQYIQSNLRPRVAFRYSGVGATALENASDDAAGGPSLIMKAFIDGEGGLQASQITES